MAANDSNPVDAEPFIKKARKKGRGLEKASELNINSMMDIMTILLVFLLVTITSDPLNVKQDQYLKLALSTADFKPEDSIPITITKRSIIVDHKAIVKVDCTSAGQVCRDDDYVKPGNSYSIDKSFKEEGSETSFLIEPLKKRLDELVKVQKEFAKEVEATFRPVATIVCDGDIPYRLIAEIVYTAGMAGLSELRFAVVKTGTR